MGSIKLIMIGGPMTDSDHKRSTMIDVAALAGVGPATVDRVLNERGNVSDATRRKVIEAARQLGLRRTLPQTYRPTIRIEWIVARPELPLLARQTEEFRAIAKTIRGVAILHVTTLKSERPDVIAEALMHTTCDCVVIYAQDAPEIREAIASLAARDIPVITLISDIPGSQRLAYAGTDHFAAGRTAGYFVSKLVQVPGPVVVLCNHLGFRSHADRVEGLRSYFADNAPGFEIARLVEGHDDRDRSENRLRKAFREVPETVAVYNVGAANLGVKAAILADVLPKRPVFIGHELTQHTARMLREGFMMIAIDQSPALQAQFALNVILDHFGHEGSRVQPPYASAVPLALFAPEYIPAGF